ncbi:organic cation transporter protein-like [Helicoverpa zea]|uniref:organic cation transporter protein-like n=1 Tax=Helicoverpa zea TaxID=7113 RepID=UPI001F565FEC|nr:organic cation transporter protein-like [Helicoverpa zea]
MTATNVDGISEKEKSDLFVKFEKFGKFQTIQFLLICLTLFMISMTHVNYVFVAENINYRCRMPECESQNRDMKTPSWWPEDVDTKCYKPILNDEHLMSNQTCTNASFSGVIEQCQHWVYENNNSIVAELNLACQPWKINLVGGIHNAGMIFSMMFTGWIADKIGRKPTVIVCAVGACIGVFKIFVTSYYPYLAIEFLESVMGSGLYTVGVVLMIEVGGSSKRVLTGIIFSYAVYVGEIIFAFLAMSFQYWKWLILVVYAPMVLFILYIFVLKESTRWQLLRGKMDGAKKTLNAIAKMNKLDIGEKEIEDANDDQLRVMFDVVEQKERENMKVIIGSKEIMTRLSVTSFCFFTSSFLYYGSLVHCVLLPGNKYTNFILAAFTSFPGEVIAYYTFNKYGRRITLQCGYFLSATFLIAQNYCPESLSWLKVVLFLVGKLGVVICFTGIYTYSLELFPTSVRGTLLGWGNTTARIGSMLAPLTPLLISEIAALPSILFSATAIISALLLTFTPETKSLPMFDTIAQIDAYKASQFKEEQCVETPTNPTTVSTKL